MKRQEFIKRCYRIVDSMQITDYSFHYGSDFIDFEFEYEHFGFHRLIDSVISYFPYSYFIKDKLDYKVVCYDNIIKIRFFD